MEAKTGFSYILLEYRLSKESQSKAEPHLQGMKS